MIDTANDIQKLNHFLRGEMSAVETYQKCIESVTSPPLILQLRSLQVSHQGRVELIQDRIRQLGGQPVSESGVWGKVAQLIERGASALSVTAAVSVLEEGEDHGLVDYQRDVSKLSPEQRRFVEESLIPEQRRSHDILSSIEAGL